MADNQINFEMQEDQSNLSFLSRRITSHTGQGKHIFKVHLETPLKAQINKQRGGGKKWPMIF